MAAMSLKIDEPVVLTEYGSAPLQLTGEQARLLRRLARDRVSILPGEGATQWYVKASSYVGTIVTADVRVLIMPKVGIANFFYLLEASGDPVDIGPAVFDYDKTRDLIPSFATFYARHLENALARGIPRAYQGVRESVPGIRGRVDLPAQIRLAGLPIPAECSFDDFTADTRLNRILRAAAERLLGLGGVTVLSRKALQRLVAALRECGRLRPEDLRSPVVFTRLNEHCRPAERLARMVLANETLQGAAGAAGAGVFLIDMNKAFEQFVAARLARYVAGRLTVSPQETRRLDAGGKVKITPDLMFGRETVRTVYVADTKYKISADGYGREADYYQILAYTTALNLPEGMLIYCQRDGDVPPTEIRVRDKRLVAWPIRLDGRPADVERQLARLAEEIERRTALT
jgi:5-methylcytosine-specific restriction enzyme subunit McrC